MIVLQALAAILAGAHRAVEPILGDREVGLGIQARGAFDLLQAKFEAGVADYLGVDVTLVRLLTVLGAVFGLGSLVVAYVVMWVLLPEE